MISENIINSHENIIADYSDIEREKWKKKIIDYRIIKGINKTAIDLFNPVEIEVYPIYLNAKIFNKGTIHKNFLHLILNNNDDIISSYITIKSLNSRDKSIPMNVNCVLIINGIYQSQAANFNGMLLYGIPYLDISEYYFNRWIPSHFQNTLNNI